MGDLVSLFAGVPPQLATFLIAMMPVGELRAAIPIALTVYDLSVWQVYLLAVAGNMVPVFALLALYGPLSRFLSRHSQHAKKFFDWLFEKTQTRHKEKFRKWGAAALILFVAIPLPITGAWTGSVAAFVFGIPYKPALGYIFLGVLIAAAIVSAVMVVGNGIFASLVA